MPRVLHDPTLPTDRSERSRELARRRKVRERARHAGADPVELLAAELRTRLDSDQRRRLAELLTTP